MRSFFLVFLFPFFIEAQTPSLQNDSISLNLKNHLQKLTSPELKGRGISNGGANLAADYILSNFEKFGLSGNGFTLDTPYYQSFVVNEFGSLKPESFIQIDNKQYYLGRDFVSMSFQGYNQHRILNGSHRFKITKTPKSDFSIHSNKNNTFYQGNIKVSKNKDEFESASKALLSYEEFMQTNPLFTVNTLSDSIIFDIVASPILGKTLEKVKENDEVVVSFYRDVRPLPCKNLLGYLPATYNTDSTIVITAHYDHLGEIKGSIYPGANDNASGVAVLLELARIAFMEKENGWQPKVNLLFIAFSAEEAGLLGSAFFTSNPPFDLSKIKYVINLDMVGGVAKSSPEEPEKLYLYGASGVAPEVISTLINESKKHKNLTFHLDGKEKYLMASDQASFIKKGVPAVFIFSGVDENCHKPTDTIEFLSLKKMTDLTLTLISLLRNLNM